MRVVPVNTTMGIVKSAGLKEPTEIATDIDFRRSGTASGIEPAKGRQQDIRVDDRIRRKFDPSQRWWLPDEGVVPNQLRAFVSSPKNWSLSAFVVTSAMSAEPPTFRAATAVVAIAALRRPEAAGVPVCG